MKRTIRTLLGGCLVATLALPAAAAGPADGSFGVLWWQTDFDRDTAFEDISVEAGAPGYRGEIWFFNKFGVRAAMFSSDLSELGEEDADYMSAEVMWRMISPTQNNFLALGAGWQDMEFTEAGTGPMTVETAGLRVTAEGRLGFINVLQAYALLTYLPEMDDYRPQGSADTFTNLEGQEVELGLVYDVAPFVDLRAAYRRTELDFTHRSGVSEYDGTVGNAGFMVGLGFHF